MMLMGLDLSTRAAAAVAVPTLWDGRWDRVRSLVAGEGLKRDASDLERARRTETIARRLVAFAHANGVETAFIESYAFNQAKAAHTLAELGGVVRLELVRAGIEIRTAPMSTARKMLLGKLPRADVKAHVYATIRAAGGMFETADEADAFCAVNWGLSEVGGFFFGQVAA
jgi:Holliday junction resolvasome RuvABC endonuclease subunit